MLQGLFRNTFGELQSSKPFILKTL